MPFVVTSPQTLQELIDSLGYRSAQTERRSTALNRRNQSSDTSTERNSSALSNLQKDSMPDPKTTKMQATAPFYLLTEILSFLRSNELVTHTKTPEIQVSTESPVLGSKNTPTDGTTDLYTSLRLDSSVGTVTVVVEHSQTSESGSGYL